ncbi:MAG: hypothetical protein ACRDLQ_09985 [Solirubrobacterales bacterium]
MRQGRVAVRLAPLLAAGALLLHRLNGLAGGDAPAGHGHSYLPLAAALVTVLLALTCATFVRELWQASRGHVATAPQRSFAVLWLLASAALLSTFALQEWIEGWVTPGHPATVAHALAHLGWVAPALAVALGAVIALLLRASRTAIVLLARRHAARRTPRAQRGRWAPAPPPAAPRPAVLAGNRADRAPPGASFA